MDDNERTRILLSEKQAKEILVKVQQQVTRNKYHILWHREKNQKFLETYYFSEPMAKELISLLDTEQDYCWAEKSTNSRHKNDIINVYKISLDLVKKDDGDTYEITLYLKFAYRENFDHTVIISFHEDE